MGGREALVKCRGYIAETGLQDVQDYQGQTPRSDSEVDAIELGDAIGYCWEV